MHMLYFKDMIQQISYRYVYPLIEETLFYFHGCTSAPCSYSSTIELLSTQW